MSESGTGSHVRRYFVSGIVQGVGYRYFAQRAARRHGLVGFVRNLRDGRVEVLASGSAESLGRLRAELARGPRGSQVTKIIEEDAALENIVSTEFRIEYDR
jgi:acylphosphatase